MGQPAISLLKYEADELVIEFQYSENWKFANLKVTSKYSDMSANVSVDTLPPPEIMSSQSIYISSTIEQLMFKMYEESSIGKATDKRGGLPAGISYQLRAAFGMMPSMGFAGGPVRTRPLRTYDPTDAANQSEGAHVPSRMAQLARTDPEEWRRTKDEIDKFGNASGLFKDIQVRRLGKGDSDPFQINVSINGPRRNIVDVGYGVSQAIPIVFELATRSPKEICMLQQPEVHLHPQAQAALGSYLVSSLEALEGTIIIETHSDYMIDRIRRHVREKRIPATDVSLLYFERGDFSSQIYNLDLNENGEIISPPDSYRDFFLAEQIKNLSL